MPESIATLLPDAIGFVGLGTMGVPMVKTMRRNLPLSTIIYIYDILPEAIRNLENIEGTKSCDSAREVCEKCECIISIVPEGQDVLALFEKGYFASKDSDSPDFTGKIFIDCSTIDISTSLQVNTFVRDRGSWYFDAPVSGGTMAAEKGTLTFMIGISSPSSLDADTDHRIYTLVRAICSTMGTNLFDCGGPSLGLATKLSNNYVSGLIAIATAEGMNLGMRLGVQPRVLKDAFSTSTAQSWVNDKCNPVPGIAPGSPPSNEYKPGFKVQLMRKDFALAVESAQRVDAKLMLGEAGLTTYTETAKDPRCRDLDSRVVYRWLGGREPEVEKTEME